MAKGTVSKALVFNKILNSFEGAFAYNEGKEIRIPMQEDGVEIQIKVALTCAKDNVVPGDDVVLPGANTVKTDEAYHFGSTFQATITEDKEIKPVATPTAEEKENVKSLLAVLGL